MLIPPLPVYLLYLHILTHEYFCLILWLWWGHSFSVTESFSLLAEIHHCFVPRSLFVGTLLHELSSDLSMKETSWINSFPSWSFPSSSSPHWICPNLNFYQFGLLKTFIFRYGKMGIAFWSTLLQGDILGFLKELLPLQPSRCVFPSWFD